MRVLHSGDDNSRREALLSAHGQWVDDIPLRVWLGIDGGGPGETTRVATEFLLGPVRLVVYRLRRIPTIRERPDGVFRLSNPIPGRRSRRIM